MEYQIYNFKYLVRLSPAYSRIREALRKVFQIKREMEVPHEH
jgi:hypothetical protein